MLPTKISDPDPWHPPVNFTSYGKGVFADVIELGILRLGGYPELWLP